MGDMFMNGLLTEELFFDAVSLRTSETPDWFVGCRRASDRFDMFGIDAIVWVTQRDTGKRVRVPIQLKRSWSGVVRHYVKYPEHWWQRIVLVVINETMDADMMRERLYDELRHVQSHRYDFKTFFKEMHKKQLDVRAQKRQRQWGSERKHIRSLFFE